jgi:hypothetical protein
MNKNIQILIAIIASMFLITTACNRDEAEEFPIADKDSFSINISFGKLSTRALSTEDGDEDGAFNENKINSLDIFFYEGSTLKWKVNSLTYDEASKKATIPISADKRSLFVDNSKSYDIYVVANNTADLSTITEGADNLQTLKDIVFQTTSFTTSGGSTPQSSFVMDGMISKVVNINSPDLGTVNLKRAAAKIRLNLVEVDIPGYTLDGNASARLVHFTDKSSLMDEGTPFTPGSSDWKETGYYELSRELNNKNTTVTPFYAYENDWSSNGSRETYFELFIPLKEDGTEITQTYKYRVPISPRDLTGDEAQYMKKLQRNFLYDVSVIVKILGSIEELPVEITGNYIIKDWGTQEILVDIKGSHYLVVSERNVTMPNRNSYIVTFNSSIPNVTLVPNSLKASYTYVNASTGQPVTQFITSGPQMPSVTVQPNVAAGNITITSAIPINFIPKDIEFQITNGPLTETVTVRQLPATYFTVTKGVQSYMVDRDWLGRDVWGIRYELPSNLNNPYMYAITTLAPAGDLIWGFPPTDSQGQTINSEEVANMISPRFEMASQFGASLPKSYSLAQEQCRRYTETAEDGTVKSGWRLPTQAEIKFIDELQNNPNNSLGLVMTAKWYWDAYSSNGAYQMIGGSDGSSTSAYVRCIRDIKN